MTMTLDNEQQSSQQQVILKTTPDDDDQQQGSPQEVVIIPSEASIKSTQSARVKTPPPPSAPTNEKLIERNRKRSQHVSYADMVITVIALIQTFTLAALVGPAVYQSFNDTFGKFPDTREHQSTGVSFLGIFVLVLCVKQVFCHMMGIWMACKLRSAADPETPQLEAYMNANQWRLFQVYKIVIALLAGAVSSIEGPSLGSVNFLWVVIRIGFLCATYGFIKESGKDYTGFWFINGGTVSVMPVNTPFVPVMAVTPVSPVTPVVMPVMVVTM